MATDRALRSCLLRILLGQGQSIAVRSRTVKRQRALLLAVWAMTILDGCASRSSPVPDAADLSPEGAETTSSGPDLDDVSPSGHHDPNPSPNPALPTLRLLPVEGFGPAVVSIPPTSTVRPLLVVAHGAGGQPEWHCDLWSQLAGNRGFVLCPRGERVDRRVPYSHAGCYFPDHHFLTEVVRASRASLVAAYPERVDADEAVFAGYSQGAVMGALMVAKMPSEFPRALFIEGGGAEWNVPIAEDYRSRGGEQIAFLCGVARCAANASAGQRWLERANVAARAVHVTGAGHTSGGAVAEKLPELFEWLVANDSRWTDP